MPLLGRFQGIPEGADDLVGGSDHEVHMRQDGQSAAAGETTAHQNRSCLGDEQLA